MEIVRQLRHQEKQNDLVHALLKYDEKYIRLFKSNMIIACLVNHMKFRILLGRTSAS